MPQPAGPKPAAWTCGTWVVISDSGPARVELHRADVPDFTPDASTLVATDPGSPHADVVAANGNLYYRVVRDAATLLATARAVAAITGRIAAASDHCRGLWRRGLHDDIGFCLANAGGDGVRVGHVEPAILDTGLGPVDECPAVARGHTLETCLRWLAAFHGR